MPPGEELAAPPARREGRPGGERIVIWHHAGDVGLSVHLPPRSVARPNRKRDA